MHVLVVDDDRDIRATLRFLLEDEGYIVSEAATGQEGLEALHASNEALVVLLDLMMPDMTGLDVLRALGDDGPSALRHAYVLLTARRESDVPIASSLPIRVVHKPFDIETLLRTIKDIEPPV